MSVKIILLALCIVMMNMMSVMSQGAYISTWSSGSTLLTCDDSITTLRNNGVLNLTLTDASGTVYFFGYTSQGNNNAAVARFDNGNQIWCKSDYDTSSASTTAYGGLFDIDNNKLFVVFSSDGSIQDSFSKFTKNGWLGNSSPNDQEVTIVLELNEDTGNPTGAGTYIYAVSNGKTNYARLQEWRKDTTTSITITLGAGTFPLDIDGRTKNCNDLSGYDLYNWILELPVSLDSALTSVSDACKNDYYSSLVSTGSSQSTGTNTKHSSTTNLFPHESTTTRHSGFFTYVRTTFIYSSHDHTLSKDRTPGTSDSVSLFSFVSFFAVALAVALAW